MPDTLTTQVLIARAQHGDRDALNALCDRYKERVLRAVRIRLGAKLRCKLQSSDVAQEVMMEVIGGLDRSEFRTDGAFMHHLNHLVELRIRDKADYWNAQRRNPDREIPRGPRSSGDGDPLNNVEGRSAPSPSSLLVLQEDLDRLERAMDVLGDESPDYRELLVAAKIEGQTYGELAEEHGGTPDAIRMKVNRAQARLAEIYHELESGER